MMLQKSISFLTTRHRLFGLMMDLSSTKRFRSEHVKGKKIAIEGNIAAGKSTFIKILEAECDEWHIVPEPVASWTNITNESNEAAGGNLLKMFYDDIHRWSYTFQSYAFFSRLRLQREGLPEKLSKARNPVQFFERTLLSDRYIFASNCYESGLMSDIEWNLYQDWTSYLLQSLGDLKLDGIIYLRADPQVCYSRMLNRGRKEEKDVSVEYLTNLHEKHEALFNTQSIETHDSLSEIPILTFDCDGDFVDNPVMKREMMKKVRNFVCVKPSEE